MADGTHIEWTDATWNPVTGCMVKSPGCLECYAMLLAGTRLKHHPSRAGLTRKVNGHHVWNGEVRLNRQWLDQPIRWKRPRNIFVVAHGDIAYEKVPDKWIDQIFAVMALSPWHRFQVLTKRPDRLHAWMAEIWQPTKEHRVVFGGDEEMIIPAATSGETRHDQVMISCEPLMKKFDLVDTSNDALWTEDGSCKALQFNWPLPNVLIGTSVERQQEADERRPHLEALARMGWNTWVSYEPALGPVDWAGWEFAKWMVSGGESGRGARPSHPDWHRATRDWCAVNSIPYFFKQWGEWREFDHGSSDYEVDVGSEMADACLAGIRPGWITRSGDFFTKVTELPADVPCRLMDRVGKARAGAFLDGIEHKAMPT